MSVGQVVYNALFKKTSTFLLTVGVGVFLFERTFDVLTTAAFDKVNEGKQWKDIKSKYEN